MELSLSGPPSLHELYVRRHAELKTELAQLEYGLDQKEDQLKTLDKQVKDLETKADSMENFFTDKTPKRRGSVSTKGNNPPSSVVVDTGNGTRLEFDTPIDVIVDTNNEEEESHTTLSHDESRQLLLNRDGNMNEDSTWDEEDVRRFRLEHGTK